VSKKNIQIISLAALVATVKTQTRDEIKKETLDDYKAAAKDAKGKGADSPFPPLVAFEEKDEFADPPASKLWLADGFTRKQALAAAGYETTAVEIRPGTARDAIEYGFKANLEHGARLTNEDKKHNLELALKDEEWAKLTNTDLAALVGVSEGFVRQHRPAAKAPATRVKVDKKTGEKKTVTATRTKGGKPKPEKKAKAKKGAAAATPEPGAPPATPEPPKVDKELEDAYTKIANACKGTSVDGAAAVAAIKDGSLPLSAREVKNLVLRTDDRIKLLVPLVLGGNRWSVSQANKFIDTVPDESTKLSYLVNRVNSLGGAYRDRVDGIAFIAYNPDDFEVGENQKGVITLTPKKKA
jgi:hypothetical protein